jgi:hypothetical protein
MSVTIALKRVTPLLVEILEGKVRGRTVVKLQRYPPRPANPTAPIRNLNQRRRKLFERHHEAVRIGFLNATFRRPRRKRCTPCDVGARLIVLRWTCAWSARVCKSIWSARLNRFAESTGPGVSGSRRYSTKWSYSLFSNGGVSAVLDVAMIGVGGA